MGTAFLEGRRRPGGLGYRQKAPQTMAIIKSSPGGWPSVCGQEELMAARLCTYEAQDRGDDLIMT